MLLIMGNMILFSGQWGNMSLLINILTVKMTSYEMMSFHIGEMNPGGHTAVLKETALQLQRMQHHHVAVSEYDQTSK